MLNRIARRVAVAAVPTLLAGVAMVAMSGTANAVEIWPYAQPCFNHGTITYNGQPDIPAETIQEGSTGDCVKYAQAIMVNAGWLPASPGIDGQFGPETKAATIDAQNFFHIQNNGQIGKITWWYLMDLN